MALHGFNWKSIRQTLFRFVVYILFVYRKKVIHFMTMKLIKAKVFLHLQYEYYWNALPIPNWPGHQLNFRAFWPVAKSKGGLYSMTSPYKLYDLYILPQIQCSVECHGGLAWHLACSWRLKKLFYLAVSKLKVTVGMCNQSWPLATSLSHTRMRLNQQKYIAFLVILYLRLS